MHPSIAAGRDVGELLPLAVTLHVHVTRMWLDDAGTPKDLRRQVASLARDLALEQGDVTTLGVAAFGTAYALLADGMLDLAEMCPRPRRRPDAHRLLEEGHVRGELVLTI